MDAFLLYGKRDIRHADIPYPEPSANEVIIKVKSVGICGSDIHYFMDGKNGNFVPKAPFALGHEVSGIIDHESPLFPELKKGTRVGVNPSQPCELCSYCQEGLFNLCPSMKYIGSASIFPHLNGGFSEFVRIPAKNCFILPEHIGFDEAALLEPLSIVLHALSKAGDLKGKSVLITGAGTIGQLTQMACKYYGSKTLITDIRTSSN
jgi:threonine dehydrogenase-like Zn-dependent dehydrogenase